MHRKLKIANRKSKAGHRLAAFTITEVVIASALLIIAMVPILKALTISHVSTTAIERKTRCLILAQAKLDEIRARAIYDYTGSFAEMNTSLGGSYLCNVRDSAHGTGLRMIGVLVGYDLNGNNLLTPDIAEEVEVALATLIAERI